MSRLFHFPQFFLLIVGLLVPALSHAAQASQTTGAPVSDEVNQLVTRVLLCAVLIDYHEQARVESTPLPDHVQNVEKRLTANVCDQDALDKAVTDARTRYATDPTVMLLLEPGALPLNLD